MLKRNPFIHLCVHSAYSLCEGALKIDKLAARCKELNMPAVALTDSGNLFGALEFSTKLSDSGIQPIIGCQLNIDYEVDGYKSNKDIIRLYAQNENGYYNLMQLVSDSNLSSASDHYPCVSMNDLSKYSDGLLALTGGINGSLNKLLLSGHKNIAELFISELGSIFPNKLYVEIQRHHVADENYVETGLLDIAYDKNLPIIATNSVCYPTPDYFEAHDVLLCIGQGAAVSSDDRIKSSTEYYLKSSDEMYKLFSDIPEAYENTSVFAKRCAFMLRHKNPIMPVAKIEGELTQDEQLRKLSKEGLEKRLTAIDKCNDPDEEKLKYHERLEYELNMISKMGFSGYFLIVADYVQWARNNDIPVGPGRGSGAGSLVAYSLTITDVDPIKFNLFFERFLNPERVSMPDFDIDFCQSRRDEVIHYIQNHYGYDFVAQIITFGKLQARAVIKDSGRAMGVPYGLTDKIAKLVPFIPTNPLTLSQAIESEKSLRDIIDEDYQVKHLMEVALKIEGMYKHTSIHAAGVVICSQKIRDLVPLYKDPKATMPVTQFSMKYIESAGLIKFDFLGLKTLTVIQKTIDLLKRKNIVVSSSHIPLDDKKTFDIFKKVDCVGVFQVESAGMKDVVRKLQPDRIEDIIALVALYRPGPMDDIPKYIACKHGLEQITYLDKKLEPILSETYGVMVYQEQVMQIAQVIGGYTLGQADILRRAMGKKQHDEMKKQEVKFIEGAQKNGVDKKIAEKLFNLMSKFASYGFNKSHSTPYGIITYQTAYLKANYTTEFFAAIMTLDLDNTDKIRDYYGDLKKHNIKMIPPDINKSSYDFIIDYKENAIVYSLSALKGSGRHAVQLIEEERNSCGPFDSVFDFIERMSKYKIVNKRLLESFIKAGAFDNLNNNRRQLFEAMDMLLSIGGESNQAMLFEKCYPDLPNVSHWNMSETLNGELESVGFYVASHPMDEHTDLLTKLSVSPISEIHSHNKVRIAGIVTSFQKKTTKNGSKFAIIGLSDSSGAVDITVFSEIMFTNEELLRVGSMIVVDANISYNEEMIRVTVTGINKLSNDLVLSKMSNKDISPITKNTKKIILHINSHNDLEFAKNIISDLSIGNIILELNIIPENSKILLKKTYKVSIKNILDLQRKLGTNNVKIC